MRTPLLEKLIRTPPPQLESAKGRQQKMMMSSVLHQAFRWQAGIPLWALCAFGCKRRLQADVMDFADRGARWIEIRTLRTAISL